ncbi:MAG: hypothetical protein WCJ51_00645 [Candidatus Moraniibacteriota bacterium]
MSFRVSPPAGGGIEESGLKSLPVDRQVSISFLLPKAEETTLKMTKM